MRDAERLDKFYDELKKLHKKYCPDWRFGQLMCNFLGWYGPTYGDPFFPEDEKLFKRLKEYFRETFKNFDE